MSDNMNTDKTFQLIKTAENNLKEIYTKYDEIEYQNSQY